MRDDDHLSGDHETRDANIRKYFPKEYELYLESIRVLHDSLPSYEELIECYTELSRSFYRLLRNLLKITRIGDGNQIKLLHAQDKLKQQHEAILELEKRNSAFAMAVTANHEINQPLMIAKGNLEMLKMSGTDLFDEKQLKYMNRIDEAIDRIQMILDRFKEPDDITFADYTEDVQMAVYKPKEED